MERSRPDFGELVVFARVVQGGSFTAAARALGIPKSTVSRKVAALEERLGARLLQRTTRKLSLTDVGRLYHQHGERAVAEMEAAELAVSEQQDRPRGLLRISAPLGLAWLGSLVASFLRRYPEVRVEMSCTDRVVDLVEEGFDVAIRAGRLADSSLIARPLATLRRLAVASPAYLDARGTPREPDDLRRHDCIVFGSGRERNRWRLEGRGGSVEVEVPARCTTNDLDLVGEAASAGLGIALLQDDRCMADLRARRLRRVLPGWSSPGVPLQAVYPSSRHVSPKLEAFVEHALAGLSPPPWDRGPGFAPRRKPARLKR